MIRYLVLITLASGLSASAQTPCEQLKSLTLPDTTITAAETVNAGLFQPPGNPPRPPVMLPAHCRVAAVLTPSPDSHIEIEVWLPTANWNGRFQAVGNGGWAGSMRITGNSSLVSGLREGYATAATDTGHQRTSGDASFAVGHPEKIVDFAYRAVHEMTVKSKAIIAAFYGTGLTLSYWNGCSTGGRQGLMEAQRYPEDFDGILAGAPANYQPHLAAWHMNLAMTNQKDKNHLLSPDKLLMVNRAVLAACDALDGVKDGLLTDPHQCRFDPASLVCSRNDGPNCLTAAQFTTVRAAYAPAITKTGQVIFPGLPVGGEVGWTWMTRPEPRGVSLGGFRHVAHEDPDWDWRTFDLDRDVALIDEKAGFIAAINPDLSAFKARGGKLLMFHGWNDESISAENSLNYYASVLTNMGPKQDNWYRLFMVPGMKHCSRGPGPNQFNGMAVLERWRETGIAPDQIIATHVTDNRVDMTRPLCPHPQVAVYKGNGSTNDAANFACKAP